MNVTLIPSEEFSRQFKQLAKIVQAWHCWQFMIRAQGPAGLERPVGLIFSRCQRTESSTWPGLHWRCKDTNIVLNYWKIVTCTNNYFRDDVFWGVSAKCGVSRGGAGFTPKCPWMSQSLKGLGTGDNGTLGHFISLAICELFLWGKSQELTFWPNF